jgi:membrane-associated phospholipid phosphatase
MQPKDKRALFISGLILCALYVLLAIIVNARLLQHLDLQATVLLQRTLPRSIDLPSSILSLLGSVEVTFPLFVLLVIVSPSAIRAKLILLFVLMSLLELQGKTMVDQPPPPDEFFRYVFAFWAPTGALSTPFSYPSGHAARTGFLAALAIALVAQSQMRPAMKQILAVLVLIATTAMLVSRAYLGEHWMSDVIGGVLLGVGLFLLAFLTVSRQESRITSTE